MWYLLCPSAEGRVITDSTNLEGLRVLVESAKSVSDASYVPYSGKPAGAALLSKSGKIYAGAKMECASFGGTVCAETAALTRAISEGERGFEAIALYPAAWPCGIDRQLLAEFGINLNVVVESSEGTLIIKSLRELLPSHFGPEHVLEE